MSIKEKIKQQFVADFDLDILLKFVEDKLTKRGEVNIGLVYDRENSRLKDKLFQTEGYSTSKKWPTFARANDHFYWTADCQIPHQLVPYVKKKLAEQGLNTKCRGLCGYDTYAVIAVTL